MFSAKAVPVPSATQNLKSSMNDPLPFTKAQEKVLEALKADPSLRDRILENGNAALAEIGVPVPAGLTVRFHENTTDTLHLALPPRILELDEDQLESIGSMGQSSTAAGIVK